MLRHVRGHKLMVQQLDERGMKKVAYSGYLYDLAHCTVHLFCTNNVTGTRVVNYPNDLLRFDRNFPFSFDLPILEGSGCET